METSGRPSGTANDLVRYFCRHFVCLNVEYVAIDDSGKDVGPNQIYTASGFVVDFGGQWVLLTAGHVFADDIDKNIEDKKIRVCRAGLIDYFGLDAKVHMPTPIDFEGLPRLYVDKKELGIDVAVIPLRDLYRANLEANGIVAVKKEYWSSGFEDFRSFLLIGVPAELHRTIEEGAGQNTRKRHFIEPVSVPVKRLDVSKVESIPKSKFPWFIGRVMADDQLKDIKGMSGGPILGITTEGERIRYSVVAIQSRWRPVDRTIFACPLSIFMELLDGFYNGGEGGS